MQRFRRILVSVMDEIPEPAALVRAASLARHTGAALKLIDVVEDFPWYARLVLPHADEIGETLVRHKAGRLEALAAPIRQDGLEVVVELLRGRPELAIIREVLRGRHDLVLKDAYEGHQGLFTSADMRLLRHCPCPVWLVRPAQQARLFERVLAAVDPTLAPDETDILRTDARPGNDALNLKILELATSLAEWDGGELHVVHAWEAPGEGLLRRHAIDSQVDRYVEDMRAAARQALDGLLAPFLDRIGASHVHLVRGAAGEAIPQFAAAKGAELIIMGTVARTGIAGFIIGNTAETILRQVQCSVLAVKPDGFVSPVTLENEESEARR